jgi:thiol-disulfide isomerase/thioredoxin
VATGLPPVRRRHRGADPDVRVHPSAAQPSRGRQHRPPGGLESALGGAITLPAAAAGRPYIVEFFETGCSHCQEAAARLCHETVPVFAIDAAKESAPTISAFRQRYAPGCSYPMLLDPTFSAVTAYAVTAVPTVYVVRLGRIVFAGAGPDGVDALPAAVQKATGG